METREAVRLFLSSRRARGLSPQTIRWYQGILNLYSIKFRKLPKSPEKIEEFLALCKAGDERRHGFYRAIRCLHRFMERRFKKANPVKKLDPPRRKPKYPRTLTPDELDQLLAFPHTPRIKTALLFLIDTGARIGELTQLKEEDLSETPWGPIARISGKTGMRFVPLSQETYTALMGNLPLNYSMWWMSRLVSRAFREAHVKGSAHLLRHTFATLWEGDELVLQKIMGHAHLSTTQLYRHLRTKTLSAQHKQYSPLNMVFSRTKSML